MKYYSKIFFLLLTFLSVSLVSSQVFATTYDCTDPLFNDPKLAGCTDCDDKCWGSITYNSCMYWCEGNNFCNGCTPCENGMTRSETSGNCICTDTNCCKAVFGEGGIVDNNDVDGCACAEGSTWNGTTCAYPSCGGDYVRHAETGECICSNESCCQRIFGPASYWNGNGQDGCGCKDGTAYVGGKCVCQSDVCCQNLYDDAIYTGEGVDGCECMPGAQAINNKCVCAGDYTANSNQRTCVCSDNNCCQRVFGDAEYDYNSQDGCKCLSGAQWNGSRCELNSSRTTTNATSTPPECPTNQKIHPESKKCIYKDDESCASALGAAYYDGNAANGCSCGQDAKEEGNKCICPDGTSYDPNLKKCITGVVGKVLHIDGTPFEKAQVVITLDKNKYSDQDGTDKNGTFVINTQNQTGSGKISVMGEGYVRVIKEFNTFKGPFEITLATVEEYEQEVKKNVKEFLTDSGIPNSSSLSNKFKFSYGDGPYYQNKVIHLPTEDYWQQADWDTIYHEVTHYLMEELAYDNEADVGYEHDVYKKSNVDTAYDEGRAHFSSILFLKYLQNKDTIAKQTNIPKYSYDNSIIEKAGGTGNEVEGVIAKFWIDYFGANVSNNPAYVFKSFHVVNSAYYSGHDFERYPRNINEWVEGRAYQIWNNTNISDYQKVLLYKDLIMKVNTHHLQNDFPYIAATEDVNMTFNPISRVGIVFLGKVHIYGGRVEKIMNSSQATVVIPHSDFVIIGFSDGSMNVKLIEGKLEIANESLQVVDTIIPEDGYKKISNNRNISNLTDDEKSDLDSEIKLIDFDESLITEINLTGNNDSNSTSSPLSWVLICGGLVFVLAGGVITIWMIIKKKKVLIIISVALPTLCVGCTISTIGVLKMENNPTTENYSPSTQENDSNNINDSNVPNLNLQGFFENSENNYSIFLGEYTFDTVENKSNPDWAESVYNYCYPTSNQDYISENCEDGYLELFSIAVLSQSQYDEIQANPELYVLLGNTDNKYFVFSHPNGDIAVEGINSGEFYDSIKNSFTFIN